MRIELFVKFKGTIIIISQCAWHTVILVQIAAKNLSVIPYEDY